MQVLWQPTADAKLLISRPYNRGSVITLVLISEYINFTAPSVFRLSRHQLAMGLMKVHCRKILCSLGCESSLCDHDQIGG
jgi:hypothetical protein